MQVRHTLGLVFMAVTWHSFWLTRGSFPWYNLKSRYILIQFKITIKTNFPGQHPSSNVNVHLSWGKKTTCETCVFLSSTAAFPNLHIWGRAWKPAFWQISQILTLGSQQTRPYPVPRLKASITDYLHHYFPQILVTLFLAAMDLYPKWGLCFLSMKYFIISGCFYEYRVSPKTYTHFE